VTEKSLRFVNRNATRRRYLCDGDAEFVENIDLTFVVRILKFHFYEAERKSMYFRAQRRVTSGASMGPTSDRQASTSATNLFSAIAAIVVAVLVIAAPSQFGGNSAQSDVSLVGP
jgi:hypothetical protein